MVNDNNNYLSSKDEVKYSTIYYKNLGWMFKYPCKTLKTVKYSIVILIKRLMPQTINSSVKTIKLSISITKQI